jgi:hypothetical protein
LEEKKEIHLVKRISKELGITYKELGEEIGYTEGNLKRAVHDNRTTAQLEKAIELYLKNLKLEKKLNEVDEMKKQFKTFINFIEN